MLRLDESVKEHQLIRDCKHGKSAAQKELYDKYAAMMLAVCFRYVKDRMEAEHVMIGGMVKVFKNVHQFKEEGSFEGWIRRIMVNESLMYLRRNKNMALSADIETVKEEPNYEAITESVGTEELMNLITNLPVGYRTVFNLYAIEGYKHDEIAEMLEISSGTSKSQLNRARKLLQKQLLVLENDLKKVRSYGQ